MEAELRLRKRIALSETTFMELVVWKVPKPVHGSSHEFKCRLALVENGVCVLRYDNEAGKGDHKHIQEVETDYRFSDLNSLQTDFWQDVEAWRAKQ